MNTYLYKPLKDLKREPARSIGIVLSLTLGIAAFLGVLATYAVLIDAMNTSYLNTDPASATIGVDRLTLDDLRAVQALAAVERAERRRVIHGRIRTGTGGWKNLVLFVRDDLRASEIGRVALESGAWPLGRNEIAIERDALKVADVATGDHTYLLTLSGKEAALSVTGVLHDVGLAQARMENLVYAYTTIDNVVTLGEDPYFDQLVLRLAENAPDRLQVERIAREAADILAARGVVVGVIDVPVPGQHPHASIMGLLLVSIAAFGVFIVALSGAIVFNVMTALLTGQARQIGVMKALGGRRRQIATGYLLGTLVMGASAFLLAIPLGLGGGFWLSTWMASFLNIDIVTFEIPLWVYGVAASVGIALPILAAMIPVLQGTRISVREALSVRSSNAISMRSRVERLILQTRLPGTVLTLAFRNIARNRLRVALTLITLAASGTFFMSALNVRESMFGTLDELFDGRHEDMTLTLDGYIAPAEVERALEGLSGIAVAESWIVETGVLTAHGISGEGEVALARDQFALVGMPKDTRLLSLDLSAETDTSTDFPGTIVNTALYLSLGGPRLGDTFGLEIADRKDPVTLEVIGIAHEPFTPARAYVERSILEFERGATTNAILVAFDEHDAFAVEASGGAMDAALKKHGIRTKGVRTKLETRFVLDQHMVMIYVFLLFISGVVAIVGLIGLIATVGLNISERRREMGVLRAIGATPSRIANLLSSEGVIVGAFAWCLAAILSPLLGKLLGDALLNLLFRNAVIVPLEIDWSAMFFWLVASLIACYFASLVPARMAARATVRDALTYE